MWFFFNTCTSSALVSGGRIYPVSVPYSNSQSTSKTSVTLSLVMPSQGTLTNGTNTASTLEEGTPTPGWAPFHSSCFLLPCFSLFFSAVYALKLLIFAFCRLILTPLSHCWALFWLLSSLPALKFYFRSILDKQDFQLPRPSLVLFILGRLDFRSTWSLHCYAYLCVSVVFTSPSFTAGCLSITPGSLKLTGKGRLIKYSWENMLLFNFPISKQWYVIYCNLTM